MKKMKFLYVLLGLALVLTGCDDGSNSNSNTSSSSGSSTPSFVTGVVQKMTLMFYTLPNICEI